MEQGKRQNPAAIAEHPRRVLMDFEIDFLFRMGKGYDDLVSLIQGNPRFAFEIWKQDKIDKRTKKAKESGWVEIKHKNKRYKGTIKLTKHAGICRAAVTDRSGGMQLIGAWTGWLASNASDLLSELDLRFV
jgi:hypothetical protein